MKILGSILLLLDRCLAPEQRKMDADDLFRARFLVQSIFISMAVSLIPCLSPVLQGKAALVGPSEMLLNSFIAGASLVQLHRGRSYHLIASIFLTWLHAVLLFHAFDNISIYSMSYIWSPCLIVISGLLVGFLGTLASWFLLTLGLMGNLFYQQSQGSPWNGLNLTMESAQIFVHLAGAVFCMAIGMSVYESMREASEKSRAEQRMRVARLAHTGAIGELVGNVAHEVNNPLAILHGSLIRLRRLLERNEWIADVEKVLLQMRESYERIIRVQQALLIFSSGNPDEPFVTLDTRTIFQDVEQAMRPQAEAQQVSLQFLDRSASSLFRCQQHQLVYVLCSLIQNAFDACRGVSNPEIVVDARADENSLFIAVSDNGRGIDPSQHERIFQPFFTTKTGGTAQGLSLSVSRGILAEHGGEIRFTSRPGATHFICQLPRSHAPAQPLMRGA